MKASLPLVLQALILSCALVGQTTVFAETSFRPSLSETENHQLFTAFESTFENYIRKTYPPDFATKFQETFEHAEQAYLQLDLSSALQKIKTLIQLLQQQWPSQGLLEKWQDTIALGVMILQAQENSLGPSQTEPLIQAALPLRDASSFLRKLPRKSREALSALEADELKIESLPFQFSQLWINSQKVQLPVQLREGQYLIHFSHQATLTAGILSVQKTGQSLTHFRKLWAQHPWEVLEKTLWLSDLKGSLTPKLKASGLEMSYLSKAENKMKSVSLAPPSSAKAPKASPVAKPVKEFGSGLDPLSMENNRWDSLSDDELQVENDSIFKSPWFWIGVGIVAGGAGYLIYDSTQNSVARTP